MTEFHKLKVIDLRQETTNTKSIAFELPPHLYETFDFKPGQYLTLKFLLNAKEERRSYSICSAAIEKEDLRIGVKRVKNGLVSNHINDHIKFGDYIEVMPPNGRFVVLTNAQNYKTYYLFAAGSGITPILSILKSVLVTEQNSYIYLLYGNRNQDSIIFKSELEAWQKQYADRFFLVHALSKPKSNWSDLWTSAKDKPYRKGRINEATIEWFLKNYPPYAQNANYFICGPDTLIEDTKQTLMSLDVSSHRIFIESFDTKTNEESVSGVKSAQLKANVYGEKFTLTIPEGKTILHALIDEGAAPPYSCEGGVCSTCVCRLKKGKVEMKNNISLTDEEVAKGLILSCQSIPLTEEIEVEYK